MHVFCQTASVMEIAWGRIDDIDPRWRKPALDVKPLRVGGHVVIACHCHPIPLHGGKSADRDIQPQELGKIGANQITRSIPSKQGRWGDHSVRLWPPEVGTCGKFCRRSSGERMGLVGGKLDVTSQGLPVEFDDLASCLSTTEGRGDTECDLMRIRAFQLKRIGRHWIGQLDLVAQRKGFKGSKLTA